MPHLRESGTAGSEEEEEGARARERRRASERCARQAGGSARSMAPPGKSANRFGLGGAGPHLDALQPGEGSQGGRQAGAWGGAGAGSLLSSPLL